MTSVSSDQVNLHSHSEGSFLDGLSTVQQIVDRAVELGQPAAAISDHGECNQHLAFYRAATKAGIRPVLGMEGYMMLDIEASRAAKNNAADLSHIVFLAASEEGLHNLWAMSSIAYTPRYFYRKPLVDPDLMRTYSRGIYASDACLITQFAEFVRSGDDDRARQHYGTLLDIYRERFYVELHTWQFVEPKTAEEHELNDRMGALNRAKVALATEMGVPMVVVNDSHYSVPDDWYYKELLWSFKTGGGDPDKMQASLGQAARKADHHMGDDEIYMWMARHGVGAAVVAETIKNSRAIAESCRVHLAPTLAMPRLGRDERDDLRHLITDCERGFKLLVTDRGLVPEPYFERLQSELRLIAEKNFCGYFRVVSDYVSAYKTGRWRQLVEPGAPLDPVLIGPGRGSAGGSLVSYLLGITTVDPIRHGLLFERFLTQGRKGSPDIDVDVPQSRRQELREYIAARHGRENVCGIGTLSRSRPKAALKDLCRALGVSFADAAAMSNVIEELEEIDPDGDPEMRELSWDEIIERRGGDLAPWARKYPELFERVQRMIGQVRGAGVHAAGVVVSSVPLLGRIPTRVAKGVTVTQLDHADCERLGAVKDDLLGLRHLDTLAATQRLIYECHDIWIDFDGGGHGVPAGVGMRMAVTDEMLAEPSIWPQIDAGRTLGIFQLESIAATKASIAFRPRSLPEVADLISVNRPGVIDAGLYETYMRRRAGTEEVTYDHPMLKDITGVSYGVLIYQEQLLQTVLTLAGFSADEADDLRKAVGKKQMDALVAMKERFIDGCLRNEDFMTVYPADDAERAARRTGDRIWASIEASGRYLFCKSHAIEYATISCWEIWTKHYFPREFLAALLQTDPKTAPRYLREADRRGLGVLLPDIERSAHRFTLEGSNVRFGLGSVHGVGDAATADLLAARPFESVEDYCARGGRGAAKDIFVALLSVGSFDCWGDRYDVLRRYERWRALAAVSPNKLAKMDDQQRHELAEAKIAERPDKWIIDVEEQRTDLQRYHIEKRLLGVAVSHDPMDRYRELVESQCVTEQGEFEARRCGDLFSVGGQISRIHKTKTKREKKAMAILTVSWRDEEFQVCAFPDAWRAHEPLIALEAPVLCRVIKLDSGCHLSTLIRLDRDEDIAVVQQLTRRN